MASPRKFLVLAKIETTQFTDAAPVAATNSILVENLKVSPLKVDTEDRNLVRSYYGYSDQIPVMEEAQIEFDVECAGASGALGTAAAYGPLLRACAFAEVLTGGVKTEYNPISSAFEYLTIYCYRDGLLFKFLGCAGNVSFEFGAKKLPHMHFRFVGKYAAVTDAAIPGGASFSGFRQPVASIPAKMGTVTIGAYAAKIAALTLDMANDVQHAIWMNNETNAIMDRRPKGSITVEMVTVATKDYWSDVRNATLAALTFTHGVTALNIFALTAPQVQLSTVEETEYNGTLALKFDAAFLPSAGNDEVKITLT